MAASCPALWLRSGHCRQLRHEVPGDVEDHMRGGRERRRRIGNRESASATKSHGDRVSPVIVEWEVQGRGGRVVHSKRTDGEIAEAALLSDGQVAGHSYGARGHATVADHRECPSDMRAEGARQTTGTVARVEDPGGRERDEDRTTRIGSEVPRDIEDDVSSLPKSRGGIGDREGASGTERDRDRVGPVITEREVESRGGRVVLGNRTDGEIAVTSKITCAV